MFRLPRPFLGVTKTSGYVDVSVTTIELQHGISAGARLRSFGESMVPLFEEHEARLERGIGLEVWGAMPRMEKAFLIAHRRIKLSLQNLQSEAEIKHAEAKAKKARRK